MEKTDIQRLREIDIISLLAHLGTQVDEHRRALCPFPGHADRHKGSFVVNRAHSKCSCFSCNHKGVDTIGLVRLVLGKTFPEACQYLAEQYGVILTTQPSHDSGHKIMGTFGSAGHMNTGTIGSAGHMNTGTIGAVTLPTFDALRYARHFLHPRLNDAARRFLFQERHISPSVASWYRLNSWTDRRGTDWLELPYYSPDGQLIGVQNRRLSSVHPASPLCSLPGASRKPCLSPEANRKPCPQTSPLPLREGQGGGSSPRFLFQPGSRTSAFGLQIIPHLSPTEELWIAEGPTDLLAMASAGHHGIAVASATLLRPEDFLPLRDRGILRWHMVHDNDAAGMELRDRIIRLANELGASIIATPAPDGCKDFGEWWKGVDDQPLNRQTEMG